MSFVWSAHSVAFRLTPDSAQGSLIEGLGNHIVVVPGIEPELTVCKGSALSTVLFICP